MNLPPSSIFPPVYVPDGYVTLAKLATEVTDNARALGRTLLATRTASASATLDFTEFNNSVYRRYEFELENVLPATDNQGLRLLVSTNGGTSYDAGAADYSYTRFVKIGTAGTDVDSAGAAFISIANSVGNAAGEQGVSGLISLWGASQPARATVRIALHYFNASAGHISYTDGSGVRLANQDTDAVRFVFAAANITSGTIRMFGII